MATTEIPIKVGKDDTAQPFSKNFDQFGNSSGFIFDVSLSTAIAADGKSEERAPKPKGPLSLLVLRDVQEHLDDVRAVSVKVLLEVHNGAVPIVPFRLIILKLF